MTNLERILKAIEALPEYKELLNISCPDAETLYKFYICWCHGDDLMDETLKSLAWQGMNQGLNPDIDDEGLNISADEALEDNTPEEMAQHIKNIIIG